MAPLQKTGEAGSKVSLLGVGRAVSRPAKAVVASSSGQLLGLVGVVETRTGEVQVVAVTIPSDVDRVGIDGHSVVLWRRRMATLCAREEVHGGRVDVTKSLHSLDSDSDRLEQTSPIQHSAVRAGLVT